MHMNFTYADIRMMPVRYRRWYIERLVKHFEKRNNMYEQSDKPSAENSNIGNFNKYSEMLNKKFSS